MLLLMNKMLKNVANEIELISKFNHEIKLLKIVGSD